MSSKIVKIQVSDDLTDFHRSWPILDIMSTSHVYTSHTRIKDFFDHYVAISWAIYSYPKLAL